jgi:Mg-chelatase subunit ChlI
MGRRRIHTDDNARKRAFIDRHRKKVHEQKRRSYSEKTKIEPPHETRMRKERQALNSKSYHLKKKATHHLSFENVAYKSRQSLGKAVSKTCSSLPKSPRKKTAVLLHPSGKYFENAPKFKSSPQNNGISAALLKQKLCRSGM